MNYMRNPRALITLTLKNVTTLQTLYQDKTIELASFP